jgi:hypothetical protein
MVTGIDMTRNQQESSNVKQKGDLTSYAKFLDSKP